MDGDVLGTLAKAAGFENLGVSEALKLFRFGQMVADAAEKAERGAGKSRALEIVGWHRNDYNGAQIDPIVADLGRAL